MLVCNVPELFYKLCKSLLTHSVFRPSSVLDLRFPDRVRRAFLHDSNRARRVTRKLWLLCLDVVLLRKWEWIGTDTRCIAHSLGVSLSLQCQGQSGKAENLARAIGWVLGDPPGLLEPESVLQFLFLLSSPGTHGDIPHVRGDHTYSCYPRYVGWRGGARQQVARG